MDIKKEICLIKKQLDTTKPIRSFRNLHICNNCHYFCYNDFSFCIKCGQTDIKNIIATIETDYKVLIQGRDATFFNRKTEPTTTEVKYTITDNQGNVYKYRDIQITQGYNGWDCSYAY